MPLSKRTYWVKRVDGLGFISLETQAEVAASVQLRMRSAHVMAAPTAAAAVADSSKAVAAPSTFHLPAGTTMAQIVPVGGAKAR